MRGQALVNAKAIYNSESKDKVKRSQLNVRIRFVAAWQCSCQVCYCMAMVLQQCQSGCGHRQYMVTEVNLNIDRIRKR